MEFAWNLDEGFCEILARFARKIWGGFKISFASRLDFHET